ncbi:unnamed protein product [Moneuplotes crassus]|uniref:Uncharacterized protein n=1 Tax=Euplotes crassus TaxID=5936 RepID=A0AAD1U4D4_EUPCR|nr:unnamed protein product [Moneuplotes crassus]
MSQCLKKNEKDDQRNLPKALPESLKISQRDKVVSFKKSTDQTDENLESQTKQLANPQRLPVAEKSTKRCSGVKQKQVEKTRSPVQTQILSLKSKQTEEEKKQNSVNELDAKSPEKKDAKQIPTDDPMKEVQPDTQSVKKDLNKPLNDFKKQKDKNTSLFSDRSDSDYKLNNLSVSEENGKSSVVYISSRESPNNIESGDSDYAPSEEKDKKFFKSSFSQEVSLKTLKNQENGGPKKKKQRQDNSNKKRSQNNSAKNDRPKNQNDKSEDMRKCKICGREFSRQGLGGHMSRAHPGQSTEYRQKKQTRNGRQDKLRLLRKAQRVYRVRDKCPNIKGTDMNRTKLNKIRDQIKQWMNEHPGMDYDTYEEGGI